MVLPRRIDGQLLEFQFRDIPRAVRKDILRDHPYQAFCTDQTGDRFFAFIDFRQSVDAQSRCPIKELTVEAYE